MNWWARQGSNLGPNGYEPSALPLSYEPSYRGFRRPFPYRQYFTLTAIYISSISCLNYVQINSKIKVI
jgi:hypothetical protein